VEYGFKYKLESERGGSGWWVLGVDGDGVVV
jgi:hypothetical protein